MASYRPTSRLAHMVNHPYMVEPYVKKKIRTVSVTELTEEQINMWFDCCTVWCNKIFGTRNLNLPSVEWTWLPEDDSGDLGWYDPNDNEIGIRIRGHRTLQNLTKTFIHEWCHLIQFQHNPWYIRWFNAGYDYFNHPMELEANEIATRMMPYCVEWCINLLHNGE